MCNCQNDPCYDCPQPCCGEEITCSKCDSCEESCSSACPINLDTDCAFYLYSKKNQDKVSNLTCLGLPKGTSLTTILEEIDTKLCEISPSFNFASYNLTNLNLSYTITNFQEFVEAVDSEIGVIENALIGPITSSIASLTSDFQSINIPNITNNGYIGLSPTDTLVEVLEKFSYSIGLVQDPAFYVQTPLQTVDSQSINFVTSGVDNHTLTGSVNIAPGPNALSIVNGGLYAPLISVPSQNTISQCTTSATINQTVSILGTNYTICDEVNIPGIIYGGGTNPLNALTIQGGKLFVSNLGNTNNNYVNNIQLGPLLGGLVVSGVGLGFSGIVDLISSEAGNRLTYSSVDGKLYSEYNLNCDAPLLIDTTVQLLKFVTGLYSLNIDIQNHTLYTGQHYVITVTQDTGVAGATITLCSNILTTATAISLPLNLAYDGQPINVQIDVECECCSNSTVVVGPTISGITTICELPITDVTGITQTEFSVDISNLSVGVLYDISIDGGLTYPVTGVIAGSTIVSGLTANTSYDVVVREDCAGLTGNIVTVTTLP